MDDLIPKLLTFPPASAPAEPLSDSQYDQSIRAILQLLTSASTAKLASGLSTGEDVFDVSAFTMVRLLLAKRSKLNKMAVRY